MHDQRRLDRHRRAIARVHVLNLARNETVRNMREPRAPVAVDRAPEKPQLAELTHDSLVEDLVAVRHQNTRKELLATVPSRGVAHSPLVVRQLALEREGVTPVERLQRRSTH
eukprot:Amastigsp_a676681_878.p4 type:complete len:112 gc:universal Amastigsp_a676681_878:450-115(-)